MRVLRENLPTVGTSGDFMWEYGLTDRTDCLDGVQCYFATVHRVLLFKFEAQDHGEIRIGGYQKGIIITHNLVNGLALVVI